MMETALLLIAGMTFFVLVLGLVAGLARRAWADESAAENGVSTEGAGSGANDYSTEWRWRGYAARGCAHARNVKAA